MDFYIINHRELSALNGSPYLQRLLYLQGIKPYVDYKTGIVGIRRGISYQSLKEALYIEPHPGIKSGSPSKDQLRRALKGLEKTGLIEIQSWDRKLVLRCLLLATDKSAQNKLATKAPEYTATNTPQQNLIDSTKSAINNLEEDTALQAKPATPQDNNYFYIFLSQTFENFWDLYPLKKEKERAFEVFKNLNPSEELTQKIIASLTEQINTYQQKSLAGIWIPAWKYPENWLLKRCWENTVTTLDTSESQHANHEKNYENQSAEHFERFTTFSENRNFCDTEFQKLWKQY